MNANADLSLEAFTGLLLELLHKAQSPRAFESLQLAVNSLQHRVTCSAEELTLCSEMPPPVMQRPQRSMLRETMDRYSFPPDQWWSTRVDRDLVYVIKEIYAAYRINPEHLWDLEPILGRNSRFSGNRLSYVLTAQYEGAVRLRAEQEAEDETLLSEGHPLAGIAQRRNREASSEPVLVADQSAPETVWHTNATRNLSPALDSVSREGGGVSLPHLEQQTISDSQAAGSVPLSLQLGRAELAGPVQDSFAERQRARDSVFNRRNEPPASRQTQPALPVSSVQHHFRQPGEPSLRPSSGAYPENSAPANTRSFPGNTEATYDQAGQTEAQAGQFSSMGAPGTPGRRPRRSSSSPNLTSVNVAKAKETDRKMMTMMDLKFAVGDYLIPFITRARKAISKCTGLTLDEQADMILPMLKPCVKRVLGGKQWLVSPANPEQIFQGLQQAFPPCQAALGIALSLLSHDERESQ